MTKTPRSLLGVEHLDQEEITRILRLARRMNPARPRPALRNRRVALVFYEPSTRTRVSFEAAAQALGARTTLVQATASSIEKGESLLDTGRTLQAAGADAIVLRHPAAGTPHLLAKHLTVPIINAGDGMHEHPTQALLDVFTMMRRGKKLAGLRVSIVGDILHSRVARSNIFLLTRLGARITLCGPAELAPDEIVTLAPRLLLTRNMDDAVRGADVIMMLRVQRERLAGVQLSVPDYIAGYQLTMQRLRHARRDAIVMHPGPIIRGMEIAGDVADSPQSAILEQVSNGVPVRMAVLARALRAAA